MRQPRNRVFTPIAYVTEQTRQKDSLSNIPDFIN